MSALAQQSVKGGCAPAGPLLAGRLLVRCLGALLPIAPCSVALAQPMQLAQQGGLTAPLSSGDVMLLTDREIWLFGLLAAVGLLTLLLLGLLLALSQRKKKQIEAEVVLRRRVEEALLEQEARLRATLQGVSEGVISLTREGQVLAINPAFAQLHGIGSYQPETIGWFTERFEVRGLDGKEFAYEERPFIRALRGEVVRDLEIEVRRRDDKSFCFLGRYNATPVSSPDRTIDQVVVTVNNFTDRQRSEQRQRLLSQEVDHRARNALAVVQAIMHLTRAHSVEEFKAAVRSRIETLARSHARLSESRWLDVDLRTLILDELQAFSDRRGDKIKLAGPRIGIAAAAVQPLSMVFHELAINAAKYGSLSSEQGELAIHWTLSSQGLGLTWIETQGPACRQPTRRGVGSAVISGSMAQVGGSVEQEWNPAGLVCRLQLPAESVILTDGAEASQKPIRPHGQGPSGFGKERVLVAEDDALLAAELVQVLGTFDYVAVGPAATLEEALRLAAGEESLAAAILDVNLGGRQSQLAAQILKARGIPYILATGYAEVAWADPGVPILQKPYPPAALAEVLRAVLRSGNDHDVSGHTA